MGEPQNDDYHLHAANYHTIDSPQHANYQPCTIGYVTGPATDEPEHDDYMADLTPSALVNLQYGCYHPNTPLYTLGGVQ
jgi:hypothetical protein